MKIHHTQQSPFLWILLSITLCLPTCLFANPSIKRNALHNVIPLFEQYAEGARKQWGVPGMAIAIVKGDNVVYAKGFGVRAQGENALVDPHTLFQTGSLVKGFTSALLAKKVDDKTIKWDDHIIDYIPAFKLYSTTLAQTISIADLASHHTGLPPYSLFYPVLLGASRDRIIRDLQYLNIDPDKTFSYQNSTYLVLANIIEKLYSLSWEEAVKRYLFAPLHMSRASTTFEAYMKDNNHAGFHQHHNGQVTRLPDNWPYHDWVNVYAPASNINASVLDLANWVILQLNEGRFEGNLLITGKNINAMHQPRTKISKQTGNRQQDNTFYGLGWYYYQTKPYPVIWHGGQTSGSKSLIAMIPDDKIGIIILTNTRNTKLPIALAKRFFDQYYGRDPTNWSLLLLKEQHTSDQKKTKKTMAFEQKEKDLSTVLPLENYTGTYYNPVYGKAIIQVDNQVLQLTLGKNKAIMILTPINKRYFWASWDDFKPNDKTRIYFALQGDNVNGFVAERFKTDAGGRFVRVKLSALNFYSKLAHSAFLSTPSFRKVQSTYPGSERHSQ